MSLTHGRSSTYNKGCRCEACTDANYWRCLRAERKRKPLEPGDPRHGTYNAYTNYKCRCDECRAVASQRNREQFQSRLERGLTDDDPRHGTGYAYTSWGCRCEACTEAVRVENKLRRYIREAAS